MSIAHLTFLCYLNSIYAEKYNRDEESTHRYLKLKIPSFILPQTAKLPQTYN